MSLRKESSSYIEGNKLQWAGPARRATLNGRTRRTSLSQVSPKRDKVKQRQLRYHSLTHRSWRNPRHLLRLMMSVVGRVCRPPFLTTRKSIGGALPTNRRQGGRVTLEVHRIHASLFSLTVRCTGEKLVVYD